METNGSTIWDVLIPIVTIFFTKKFTIYFSNDEKNENVLKFEFESPNVTDYIHVTSLS